MRANGGLDVWIRVFMTSELVGREWSASHPGRFTPGEGVSVTNWMGGRVDPRISLDDVENTKISPQL
jgi:hypothetical protein